MAELRPFLEVSLVVLRTIPEIIFTPGLAMAFWLVVWLVFMQYRRVAGNEERLYGLVKNPVRRQLLVAMGLGLGGGIFASLLLVTVGVTLTGSGVFYLLPLALLLYLVSPRLMCFSYAGGLVSLSSLVLGWPEVSVPAIMALVAVLHITESLLISMSGAGCVTPLFIAGERSQVVGAYGMQRFWPVPLVVLFAVSVPDITQVPGLIAMPGWWPLIGANPAYYPATHTLVYTLGPVMAALGYSDLAVASSPPRKSLRTAGFLAAYSVCLLLFAVLAARLAAFRWVAALFGPLGHEWVIRLSNRGEMRSQPLFTHPSHGVRVLDVMPGGPAARAGIAPGDVIYTVNGIEVNYRDQLQQAVAGSPDRLELTVQRRARLDRVLLPGPVEHLQLVTVPEPGDEANVDLRATGRLVAWWRRRRVGD